MTSVPRNIVACALALALWPASVFAQTRTVPPPSRFGGGPKTTPATPAAPATLAAPATPAATPAVPANGELTLPGEKEALQDCKKFPPNKKFKWELRGEVDLMTMLNAISPMLCKPFIIPGSLRQSKVTILAPDMMTAPEAYRMFLAAIESMGLTVQPQGKVLKIIESARARESAIPIYSQDNNPPAQDQYVTRLLRLEHVPVEDVKGVLDRLKGKDADITVYGPTNTLVITDLASNIRKMEEVVTQLDVAMGGERIWVIKLRTLSATDMAATLQQIFGVQARGAAPAGQPAGGRRPNLAAPKSAGGPAEAMASEGGAGLGADMAISQIIPDDRNNLLIIVGTEKAYQRIYAMVRRLDQANSVRGDAASDVVHVIPLANANVDDVAGTLAGVGAGVSRSGGTSGSNTSPGGRPPTQQGASGSSAGQKTILFEGDVRIAADKATNSLVAVATGRDYITLRDLVKKLDVVRRQVFVECVILEVSVDKTRTIGFAWHGGNAIGSGNNQSLLFGGSEPSSDVNSILFSPTSLSGLAAGLRGPSIPNADKLLGLPSGTSVPSFGVFVQFLQNNGDVNVISMPHILTTDNEKASISVGQNLPFPGALGVSSFGSLAGAAGAPSVAGGIGTSVQRQDVALKLDITPHVNEGDFVRLEIENEISDVANPNYNGLGPSTTKRTLKTQVTVRDQQTIVLGGLIKDSVSETVQKVPLLGDIPILGYLFKKTNKAIVKQNLLIILTPYIIKDVSDMRHLFERKLRERREFMERSSAFHDDRDYEAQVDYHRKRGLLEKINRTAHEAELEASELRDAEAAMQNRNIEGALDLPMPLPMPRSAPGQPVGPGQSSKPPVVRPSGENR